MTMWRVRHNHLILWFVGLNAAYWSFSWLFDAVWLSAFFHAFMIVSGVMLASTAVPDAVSVLRKGESGPGELAVIAITGISIGLVYSGLFGLVWNLVGRPPDWIGPVSTYGRSLTAGCMLLLFLSPEATRQGIRAPKWWVVLFALVFVVILLVLGTSIVEENTTAGIDYLTRSRAWLRPLMTT